MTILHYLLTGIALQAIFYYKERKMWCAETLEKYPIVSAEFVGNICFLSFYLRVPIWPWELFKRLRDGLTFNIKRLSISIGIIKTTFGFGVSVSFPECPKFMSEILCGPLFIHVQYLTKENVEMICRPLSAEEIEQASFSSSEWDFLNKNDNEQKT